MRFDTFELDLDTGNLTQEGRSLKLQPQPGKLLAMLVREPGTVVAREAIQNELWPDGTFVDFDQSINFCIRRIREVLDDDAARPRYVETMPRRGYRFLARVESNSIDEPITRPETRAPDPSATRWKMIGAGVILLLVGAGWSVWRERPSTQTRGPVTFPFTTTMGHEFRPALSPNGSHVAFLRREEDSSE